MQVWKLSATDLCEIARNSVLHSGYPHQVQRGVEHRNMTAQGQEARCHGSGESMPGLCDEHCCVTACSPPHTPQLCHLLANPRA